MALSATDDPATQLAPYVRAHERLLWSGRPDPAVRFSPSDAYFVPFTIMWGGFAILWEVGVIASGAGPFFFLWGIPFVGIGLYMIVGRFIVKRRRKLKTAYGVTTERALVAVGDSSLSDSPIKHVPTQVRRSRDRTHVSITFGKPASFGRGAYANSGLEIFGWGPDVVAFYDVPDPEVVLAAIDRAQR